MMMNQKPYNGQLNIIDYLYVKASKAYMIAGGPPDPRIRSVWIKRYMQHELEKMNRTIKD